jgi:hypothetical protein
MIQSEVTGLEQDYAAPSSRLLHRLWNPWEAQPGNSKIELPPLL